MKTIYLMLFGWLPALVQYIILGLLALLVIVIIVRVIKLVLDAIPFL